MDEAKKVCAFRSVRSFNYVNVFSPENDVVKHHKSVDVPHPRKPDAQNE